MFASMVNVFWGAFDIKTGHFYGKNFGRIMFNVLNFKSSMLKECLMVVFQGLNKQKISA